MDNKDAIDGLKFIKLFYSNKKRDTSLSDFDIEALDKAIKSLEAWDEINEELEKEMNEYENVLSDLSYSDGIGYALDVIEEHLKEIE